jgi:hypothetical protein
MELDADAAHEVALLDVHASCTPWPKLMVDAWAGAVIITVGMGLLMLDIMPPSPHPISSTAAIADTPTPDTT